MLRKIWVLALIGILSVASIHAQDEVQENSVSINSTWVKIWSRQVKQKHYTRGGSYNSINYPTFELLSPQFYIQSVYKATLLFSM